MKLIIDVDEDFYKKCTNYVTVDKFFPTIHQVDTALSSIGNGIPLDDIRLALRTSDVFVENDYDRGRNYGLHIARQILDKHIGGAI